MALAGVMSSVNAAVIASMSGNRRAAAEYDLYVALLEEGRYLRLQPATRRDGGGRYICSTALKIAIRSMIGVATILAEAFLVSQRWSKEEALPWLVSLVMPPLIGAALWMTTCDFFSDLDWPDYLFYKTKRRPEQEQGKEGDCM